MRVNVLLFGPRMTKRRLGWAMSSLWSIAEILARFSQCSALLCDGLGDVASRSNAIDRDGIIKPPYGPAMPLSDLSNVSDHRGIQRPFLAQRSAILRH